MINVCVRLFGFGCILYWRFSFYWFLLFSSCWKWGVFCGVLIIKILWIFVNISVESG